MINSIFKATVRVLESIANYTKSTYRQVNVVIWFFIIPITWLMLINNTAAIVYASFCIGIYMGCKSFKTYSNNLFYKSVTFLLYFTRYGMSYEFSSIIFCLVIPALIYIILLTT